MSNIISPNPNIEISFVDLMKRYNKILVPKIQRDYAQGRKDEKATDIRKNILGDIFSGREVKFDFIFGTKENNKFIPLDGQQRLTTLFLLHLYAQKKGQHFQGLDLSKFTYDTRRASREFCEGLIKSDWTNFNKKNISEDIKNCTWFLNYWQYDPTVSSMLTMLDAIHQHPESCTYSFENLENIKFYFFDLNKHNLSENLYLKMNARGKPLTAFENFKAALDKILPEDLPTTVFDTLQNKDGNLQKYESFKEKWQYCIDRQWTDFFWQYQDNHLVDVPFMRFICSLLAGYWAAHSDLTAKELKDNETLNNLLALKIDANTTYIPFDIFQKVFELPNANALSCIAKLLCDSYQSKEAILKNTKPAWNKDNNIDVFIVKEDFKNRAIFFALSQYAGIHYEDDNFKDWMRFAWSIAENHVSSKEEYIAYCKMIGKISSNSNDILSFLSKQTLDGFKKNISGFASEQIDEEIVKAKFILEHNDFKDKILEAEKHKLFRGCIRFLFKSSQEIDKAVFIARYNKANEMFDENGITEPYKNTLLRALISQFDNWEQFWKIEYDNSANAWRKFLKDRIEPLRKVIDSQESLEDLIKNQVSPFDNDEKLVHEDLYKSNLLNADIVLGCKLNLYWGKYVLYPYNAKAEWKKYIIGYHRNVLLSKLSVDSKQKLPEAPYYWGWNVEFSWKGKTFIWTWNDEIVEKSSEKKISSKEINDIETLKDNLKGL